MAKKKNDQNFISELLGKLKASYASPEEQPSPSAEKDTSDEEFQKQLRSMLGQAPAEAPKKKAAEKAPAREKQEKKAVKKSPSAKLPKPKAEPQPQEEEPLLVMPEISETPEAPQAPENPEEAPIPSIPEIQAEEAKPVMAAVEPEISELYTEESKELPQEKLEEKIEEEETPQEPTVLPATEDTQPQETPVQKKTLTKKADVSEKTIVIRPKTAPRKQEPIVIRPREQKKSAPAPTRVEESISKEPIKIGRKEEHAPVKATATAKPATAIQKEAEEKATVAPTPVREESNARAASPSQPIAKAEKAPKESAQEPVSESTKKSSKETATSSPLPFSEQIYQKTGLSGDDLSLLFELGYDGELANLVGSENLKKLKSEDLRKKNLAASSDYPTALGYRGREYTDRQDNSGVLAAYIRDRKFLIARLILTALATLCLLFIDVPALRGARLTQISQNLPLLLPIVGMLLLISTAALSAKQILAGVKSLLEFTPTPYSVGGVLIVSTLIYNILAMLLPSVNLPVNLAVALVILAIAFCDVFRLWGELRVFRLLSQEGEKHVLEAISLRKKKMKYGDKTVKILNDDIGEHFYRVAKARNITGFFRRFNTEGKASRAFSWMLLAATAIPLLLSLAVAAYTLSFSASVNAFIACLILGAPVSAVFGVFYPLFHANRILTRHQCALIGSESAEEYSLPKTLVMKDGEVFHTEKCTEIALDESGDFQNDIKLASALFRTVGSTLEHLGQASESTKSSSVSLLRILENGVEATVNEHHLLAGDASFLKRYGIRVPKESSDRTMRRTENVSVMYVAIDGTLKLSYEIDYTEKFTFEKTAEALAESKTSVAIHSYDPNLNAAFVQKLCNKKEEPLRVIKPGRYEDECVQELVDTGAVSLDSPEKTLCALQAAAKIGKIQELTVRLQLIASLLGCMGAFLLQLFEGAFPSTSTMILYHIFWIAVSFAATHIELREDKLHLLK